MLRKLGDEQLCTFALILSLFSMRTGMSCGSPEGTPSSNFVDGRCRPTYNATSRDASLAAQLRCIPIFQFQGREVSQTRDLDRSIESVDMTARNVASRL